MAQTLPLPTMSPFGVYGSWMLSSTLLVAGSIRTIVLLSGLMTLKGSRIRIRLPSDTRG